MTSCGAKEIGHIIQRLRDKRNEESTMERSLGNNGDGDSREYG